MENRKAFTNGSGGIRRQSSALGDEESAQDGRETPASTVVLSDPSSADGGELQELPGERAFIREHFPPDFDPALELSRIRNAASDAEAEAITREHFSRLGPHSLWRSMMWGQEAVLAMRAKLLERPEARQSHGASSSDGQPSHAAGDVERQEEQE
ncbi:unnamed protein product [Peniophora sp. CBMAI 1063]|nr:unnamed protein product [Peniophora sp. CBMAI 1063]